MQILVVGGAGYIGAHTSALLVAQGHEVVVLDDLSSGEQGFLSGCEFIQGDCADVDLLQKLFLRYRFSAVMHFASFIQVGESVQNPSKYYQNNVAKTLNLLNTMLQHQVNNFIFSSSAAVYGSPHYTPIDENHPPQPINPYGRSKLMVEQILADYATAYGLKSISLRYFNAAGADLQGRMGENHEPETHLIPLLLQSLRGGPAFTMYGNDYSTPDGSCIRDYVHVLDIASAHLLAAQALIANKPVAAMYNLGTGQGFSIKQVIDAVASVTGQSVSVQLGPRRAGDPAILVADNIQAKTDLGWELVYSGLDCIIRSAWTWENTRADFFDSRKSCLSVG